VSERIDNLRNLIERQEKCRAKHIESVVIHERFEGMRVWDGVVETFQLDGHPEAKRAYAWVAPASQKEEPQYTIVLGVPPVNSAQDAVKAAVLGGFKKLVALGREILDKGRSADPKT
jgi:hypothetical protein